MTDIETQLDRTIHYPSAVLPAPPAFDIDLPTDWEVGQIPGVLMAAGPASWDGPFRTNITIAAGLVDRGADPRELAGSYVTDLPEDSYQIVDLDLLDEDTAQLIVTLELAEPPVQVLQSIVVVKVDNRPADSDLVSLLTITASTDTARGETDGPLLANIVRSLQISVTTEE